MWLRLNKIRSVVLLAGLVVAAGVATAQTPIAIPGWSAKWIQAPWSTARDGAELDGGRLGVTRGAHAIKGGRTKA